MKTMKFTLMFLACSAALPALAQTPECGPANFDQSRRAFTVVNAPADAVNQQCFVTVVPSGSTAQGTALVEGTYLVELSGGGGGGGGGSSSIFQGNNSGNNSSGWHGGGGGGASAAVSQTTQYLSPGVYKLTIGTGGEGGGANGGMTEDGNPTSLTKVSNGQLVAGFPNADTWRQNVRPAGTGQGGAAYTGAASGQNGDTRPAEQTASGGSGGAGFGAGGGTGGIGGVHSAQTGGRGGHGFIKLAMQTAAAPAVTGAQGSAPQRVEPILAPKRARN